MGLSIILTTLLNTLTSSPDLCADVYVDANGTPYADAIGQTWSVYCDWTGPDAPLLDLDVCCSIADGSASCALPNRRGRCSIGSKVYCEHGEVTATGEVVCYQPFPSTCDFGSCGEVLPPDGGPIEDSLCCWDDGTICTEIETVEDLEACAAGQGISSWCKNGATNLDGTVDCFE